VQSEGEVRTSKETEWARGTHVLSNVKGGTSQDTERNQASEGYAHSVERKRSDHVRISKESERARGTHNLSSAKGRTSQNAERN
jgi:hypothetical protein